MPDEALAAHLRRLGLDAEEEALYRAALAAGPCTLEHLASRLDRDPALVQAVAERLIGLGLLAGSGDSRPGVVPLEPTWALERLLTVRSAELQDARLAAAHAYRAFRRTVHPPATEDLVEVVTGDRIKERIHQVEAAVEHEVLRLDSPPYHTGGGPNPLEIDNLARGVVYRAVYAKSAVQNTAYYAGNVMPCISAGEQARVASGVPVKLAVFDGREAQVSMSSAGTEADDSLLVVRPSSLLSALVGLFETAWQAALPLHFGERVPRVLRPLQRRILELLSSGLTDETMAELLGISRRTLSRHLADLSSRAGATTRFQLALHAVRRGWID
ncbi:helix-turn-helix transcriptional regulator [Streptomyces qinglanensis]|uniref:HTH domain-containing protein n=1 Tax=Streptomyces qinglanensis TaxID=943816 RepID=A0A1H9SEA0_9ACTN|nr:helix-turn-helix transcriptional regulator [Streptomyces qinglanensis]SER83297.1 HTH domain-containing protein [Streptomyces qinglanensis]